MNARISQKKKQRQHEKVFFGVNYDILGNPYGTVLNDK